MREYTLKSLVLKSAKILEESIEEKLHDPGFGNDFPAMTLEAQTTKVKIDQLDDMKFKTSVHQREQQSEKATYRMGENICNSYIG